MKAAIFKFAVCGLAIICNVYGSSSEGLTASAPVKTLARATLDLITLDPQVIDQLKSHKQVVLVVGNSGVGKSTISKFISGRKLISYKSKDTFKVKDGNENSTHLLPTTLNEMYLDSSSDTLYYEIPAFKCSSTFPEEVATAWAIKAVLQNVAKVKILLVSNYASLRSGESRADLKSFLAHSFKFVQHPAKYAASIALVASKVDSFVGDEELVGDISRFLTHAKDDVETLFGDDAENVRKATEVLDALLHQNSNGTLDRIGFFRSPNQAGELDQIPQHAARRQSLQNMVERNIEFTASNELDFGFKHHDDEEIEEFNAVVTEVIRQLQDKFNCALHHLGELIVKHCHDNLASKSEPSQFSWVLSHMSRLELLINNAVNISTRAVFVDNLNSGLGRLPNLNLKQIEVLHKELGSFEALLTSNSLARSPVSELTAPLKEAWDEVTRSSNEIMIPALIRKAETELEQSIVGLKASLNSQLLNSKSLDAQRRVLFYQGLEKDISDLQTLINALGAKPSYNTFMQSISTALKQLSFAPDHSGDEIVPIGDIQFNQLPKLSLHSVKTILEGFEQWLETTVAIKQLQDQNQELLEQLSTQRQAV